MELKMVSVKYFNLFFLLTFLTMQLSAMKADWAVQISSTGQINTRDIVIDSEGNSYSTGMFTDSLFVNTVSGADTLIDKKFGETFIIKMDSCGNLIWAKQFYGQSNTNPSSLVLNSLGQLIIIGTFSHDTDFDPSPKTFIVDPAGGEAVYICILDIDGNFVSVGRLGGSPGMYSPNIAIDDLDNIFVSVAFSGGFPNNQVDLDPNLSSTYYVKPNGLDGAIIKMDPQGNLDWVYHIMGPGFLIFAGDITINGSEISASFHFSGQISFDTGSGSQGLQSRNSSYDGLIIHLSSTKQFLGYSYLEGNGNVITKSIKSSINNGIYLSGYFFDSLLVQSNGQTVAIKSEGNFDSYVSHWSTNGDLLWMQQFSSKKDVFIRSMEVVENGNIYLSGVFQDTLSFEKVSNQLISNNENNLFIAVLNSKGNFIHAEKINIKTTLQNHIAIDSKENIYGFSNFSTAFLNKYDGDTTFIKNGSENALLFKLSNEANRINLGADKSICATDSLILKTTLIDGDEIKWSTGENTPTITIKQAGTFHVKVSNCGRVFRDTIVITTVPKPIISLGVDTTFCENFQFLIEPAATNATKFFWNTNDTTKNLLVNKAGEYILRVENGPHCFVMDTITIDYKPVRKVFPFSDTVLCGVDEFILDAGNSGSSYSWSNGEKSQKITVNTDGVYSVEVNNSFCSRIDSVKVSFLQDDECLPRITVPNVFTPNNDGINDFFKLESKNINEVELQIYSRWGQLVFISDSKEVHWDGRFQGKQLEEGNYFFVIQYSYTEWGETEISNKQLKGSVTLLR